MSKDTRPIMNVDANTLQSWRKRMGYSQDDACHELGCARSVWQRWENGGSPVPRYIGLACAALALGMLPYDDEGK